MPRYTDIDKLLEIFDADEPMNWSDTEAEIQAQRDHEYYRGLVENAPTADAAEVVRCKDCIYWDNGKDYEPYCNNIDGLNEPSETDFCSYGERKEK